MVIPSPWESGFSVGRSRSRRSCSTFSLNTTNSKSKYANDSPLKRTYSHIDLLKQFSIFNFPFLKPYCAPPSFTAPKNLSGLSTPFCSKYQINISCKFKGINDENFSIACITMSACSDFCVVIEESAYIYL